MKSLFALACASMLVAPLTSYAEEDPKAIAKAMIDEGNRLYEGQQYSAALARYEAAYEAYASPKIFYNLARCHDRLEHPVEAAELYERFLLEGGVQAGSALHDAATQSLAKLDAALARLTVEGPVLGAEVFVDGARVGVVPLEKKRIASGAHAVVIQRSGYHPKRRELTFEAGATQALAADLELAATVTPAPQLVEPAPVEDEALTESPWFWVAVGVLAASVGVGVAVAASSGSAARPDAALGSSPWSDWDPL